MNRRRFLAALGAGAAAATAGCTSRSATTSTTPTSTSTSEAPTTTSTTKPQNGDVYGSDERVLLRDGNLSAKQLYYTYREEVPYYDKETESVSTITAPDGLFLSYRIEFYNRGGEELEMPSLNPFSAWVAGDSYPQLQGLPDGVSWEQLRQGDVEYMLYTPWWASEHEVKTIAPDGSELGQFLFSIPSVQMDDVFVKWAPESRNDAVFFQVE